MSYSEMGRRQIVGQGQLQDAGTSGLFLCGKHEAHILSLWGTAPADTGDQKEIGARVGLSTDLI
jgi:hypothetical protein